MEAKLGIVVKSIGLVIRSSFLLLKSLLCFYKVGDDKARNIISSIEARKIVAKGIKEAIQLVRRKK